MTDIFFENVSYVPLLPMVGVGIGRHSGMILPNSGIGSYGGGGDKYSLRRKKEMAAETAKKTETVKKILFTS
jgi:hypothetical protein